jgi:3-oxoacyl-[acyl-carrier protein] reductase
LISTGLSGRTVIITGAAQGIGRATALAFAAEGAFVSGWDLSSDDSFVPTLRDQGGDGELLPVNVTDAAAVDAAARDLGARRGSIDVLINNAGILRDALLVKVKDGQLTGWMTDEQFDAVLDVNLKGTFQVTRAVVPSMIRQKRGAIVNASSVVALYGNFGQTNYVASKAAVIGMTKVWARELGRYNIRVNAVAPGVVMTEIFKNTPESALDALRAKTPLGRLGDPAEIAQAYLWLASSAASFITGTVLNVDGGIVTGT